ncbi:MAG: PAS domain S-box protein [Desulfarculus sp.]|nr:PAS domain S-box protein [Desulfarculus sp.]
MDRHKLEQSLSWRRVAYMGFAALVFLMILAAAYSLMVFRALRDQGEKENLAADLALAEIGTQFISDHQESLLDRLLGVTARNVFRQAVRQPDLQDLQALLRPLGTASQEVESVFLTDAQGRLLLSLPPLPEQETPHPGLPLERPSGTPARPWVSPVHPGLKPPHQPVVTLSVPILDNDGSLRGFLGVCQRVEYWEQFFQRLSSRPGRTFHLFDQRGRLVAQGVQHAAEDLASLGSLTREVREDLQRRGRAVSALAGDPESRHYAFASAAPVPDLGWVLVVVYDYQAAMSPTRAMFKNIVFFLLLLFGALIVMGFLMLSRYRMQQLMLGRMDEEARRLEAVVQQRTADLRSSTERYRSLVQDLPDMVYEMDALGKLTFVSNASQTVLGYRPEEMVGHPRREYVLPEDRHKFDDERTRAEQGEQLSNLVIRHLAKDGGVRWLAIHSRGIFDGQGNVVGRRGVARDMSQQVLAERRVRELSHLLIKAQEEERKRVALDLHDELGQLLSALKIGLQSLASQHGGEESGEFERLIRLSQKIMDRIRALAYHLRPAILDSFGLVAALEDLCDSLAESGLVEVERHVQEFDENAFNSESKLALFRFVQESLTNVVKHAHSPRAEVRLEGGEGFLRVMVRDFGRGFNVEQALGSGLEDKHLGLLGMEERIRLTGGQLSIQSSSEGTTLTAVVPLGEKP